ncbi:peptidase S41 [Kangiella profundi]|uniref:Peptidase S41 n=1 Tax=Kangiella profundi TaxID=1561924 RepID=A0A2K9B0P9_9GAMM|nr:S41 family peptidase [Kangiella profundi]AUD79699.1 peptidase S41 [Kangiella profundi]GGE96194.1 peptidase S41 [Kangiella profundi]
MKRIVLACIIMLMLPKAALAEHPNENPELQSPQPESSIETLPLDELAALADVYAEIKKSYVHELTDKEILDGAIRGMLYNLDPYSSYLNADQFAQLEETATGDYAGIGIEALHLEDGIKVMAVMADSPAKAAGLEVNDMITAIGDLSAKGLSDVEGSDLMRGPPGSKVTLSVIKARDNKTETITITRQIIHTTSVRYQLLESGIGYAHINEFQIRTANDLSKAISAMEKKNQQSLTGFILDLRNNPGGLLDGAIEVSDLFLNEGVIVSTKGRLPEGNDSYSATSGDILGGKPMVVLINGSSASASEIVAGALQDHHRGTIIGTQSYGKAMVQTILPIHGGNAVKLTTALYYTPSGKSIQGSGITPDRLIEFETLDESQNGRLATRAGAVIDDYQRDNQVMAALNYLFATKSSETP